MFEKSKCTNKDKEWYYKSSLEDTRKELAEMTMQYNRKRFEVEDLLSEVADLYERIELQEKTIEDCKTEILYYKLLIKNM